MGERYDALLQPSVYTAADFYLLRAPVLPAHVFSQIASTGAVARSNEDIEGLLTEARQRCYDLLQSLASQPVIEQALAAASFAIFEGVARIRRGEDSRRAERTYSRLLRYIVRMSTRPTPFGLFAGVAVGAFADNTTVQLAIPTVRRIRTRPDMSWVLSVIQKVEQTEELIPQLHMVVNQTVYLAGGRAMLPYADVYGQRDSRSINVRATPVVQYVLEHARQAIQYTDLRTELLERFPQATPEQVDALLQQLWENHFLTSNLRPPLTSAHPTHYVLEQVSCLPHAQPMSTQLKEVLHKAAEIDRVGMGGPVELIRDLTRQQEQLVPESKDVPFQIDTALHMKSSYLNKSIGEAAAQAAETLLRLSRVSQGLPHLQEYRSEFVERYGADAEVPLLDLLSPESGLDAPPTYVQPQRTYRLTRPQLPPDQRQRDTMLCGLLAQTVNDRCLEVELTASLLQQLEQWSPQADNPAPPSLEIYLQVHATSREALDRGEWRVVVSPNCGSPGGGRTFSRFFDILESEGLEMLQRFTKREESLSPDVIFAELSYLPTTARSANVAVRPALRDYEIVINTTPSVSPEKVIHLNDLVVGVRNNRFYLRSLRFGKEVVVCQSHMLNPMIAPNICRFLVEISQDNRPCLSPFDWGTASASPFLPRIVQGRVVLCPAQWNLKASTIELTDVGSEDARWFTGLQQWRKRWRVPHYVYIVEADNRLLLDLEHPLMAAELRTELAKVGDSGTVKVQEVLPDFDHLWLQDGNNAPYFAEIVVPLIRTDAPRSSASKTMATKRSYPPRIITREERRMLPGATWTYLKLYAAFQQHDACIAGPLREVVHMLQEQGMIDRWFFIRYTDPEPHLRLRFHAANEQIGERLLVTALAWARQQVEKGMLDRVCVDTYDREVERYGGPRAIDALEQVFAVDSAIVSAIIAAQYTGRITLDPLAVAVFSLDRFFAAWGLDCAERLLRLESRTEKYQASKEFREQRKLLCELLSPWEDVYDRVVTPQREQLCSFFAIQDEPLHALSEQIHRLSISEELWLPEENILDSLAHMHVNRLLGINREQEIKVYAFWRHTLESVQRRSASKSSLSA
ncbi:MAG: lantibiotic dehydratase [Ktedonobacteraceae bacterium]|nr:lantibiotic dehydratase [Ktedonobacteraceae bacterium]